MAETIGKKAEGNAGYGKNDQQPGLQRAELRIGDAELVAQERHQRHDDLTIGKIDEINQREYGEEPDLIRCERSGVGVHPGSPETWRQTWMFQPGVIIYR